MTNEGKPESPLILWLKDKDLLVSSKVWIVTVFVGLTRIILSPYTSIDVSSYLYAGTGLSFLIGVLYFPVLRYEWDNKYRRKANKWW